MKIWRRSSSQTPTMTPEEAQKRFAEIIAAAD